MNIFDANTENDGIISSITQSDKVALYTFGGNDGAGQSAATAITASTWFSVVTVFDTTAQEIIQYLNGSVDRRTTGFTDTSPTVNPAIGYATSATAPGTVGLACLQQWSSVEYGTPPIADHIGSEYNNQSDPVTFFTASAWEDQDGGVTLTATLGAIEYSSNDTLIGLTGSVDVLATLGAISYSSNDAVIQVSGDVNVIATLGTINYESNNTLITVFGDVDLTATLGTINYNSNDVGVSLIGGVNVTATLGTIDYTSSDTVITLEGQVSVLATLGTISYDSYNVNVQVGTGQIIGTVTSGFANDIYSSSFKPNTITVNFKS